MVDLLELVARLAEGCGELPADRREESIRAVKAFQAPSGGFRGRAEEADLYYTAFAVRTLAILDGFDPATADSTRRYLQSTLQDRTTLVDLVSLLFAAYTLEAATGEDVFETAQADWSRRFLDELERHRCDDGGFARTTKGAAGSTYQTFLNLLCYELLDQPIPQRERLISFVLSQRAAEGGFLEIRAAKRAGTNPTAAAVGSLEILGALTDEIRSETVAFLHTLLGDEGGFRANTRIPISDLLSTFTGLWTLDRLGGIDELPMEKIADYVSSLEVPGGFLGAVLDEEADVEYLFYGVGTLGLLALLGA